LTASRSLYTKEEVDRMRQADREIGANDLALALYDRLGQEIALCESMIRQNPEYGIDNWKSQIRMDAIMFCLEVLGELNDLQIPKK